MGREVKLLVVVVTEYNHHLPSSILKKINDLLYIHLLFDSNKLSFLFTQTHLIIK